MSLRTWVSIITVILLAIVVYFGRHEILHAWHLLGDVNLWILAIVIPVQLFSYYAIGGMIFSYLRSKGDLKTTSHWEMTRMALELNFVNHILPSGGAAGFSYLGWVLGRHGVSAGRATMAQIIRFVLTFVAFVLILVGAVVALTLDHRINRVAIAISGGIVVLAVAAVFLTIYIIGSKRRLTRFSEWLARTTNRIVAMFSRREDKEFVKVAALEDFFGELHDDYLVIRRDKRILIKPFIWGVLANIADVALLMIAFMALGTWVNPATLFVAFGVSSIASVFSVTPGGAGVYETVMIAFLASASVGPDIAIAGTLLARVTLLLGTILFGYIFYQMTIIKYGKSPITKDE